MQKTFVEKSRSFRARANQVFVHENLIALDWTKIHNTISQLAWKKFIQHEFSKKIHEVRHISVPTKSSAFREFFSSEFSYLFSLQYRKFDFQNFHNRIFQLVTKEAPRMKIWATWALVFNISIPSNSARISH